jgi:hypothetical protein
MNDDTNPAGPPRLPPPPQALAGGSLPPGEDPSDRVAIRSTTGAIEAMLRQPARVLFQLRQPGAGKLVAAMLGVAIACGLIYGVVVGSFSGHSQWWAAPIKISAGLMVSALICMPSLYIFACLSGSQARVWEMAGLLVGLLMLMTLLLIGFAPVAWLFSQSTQSVAWMGALHLLFFFVATIFALRFLKAGYMRFHARSNAGLTVWIVIFLLVMLQMTTALRPIVGTANTFLPQEKKFFLNHWVDSMEQKAQANVPPR